MAGSASRAVRAPRAPALGDIAAPAGANRRFHVLARLRLRAASVPPPAWLAALIVVSAVNLIALGQNRPAPWILPDELIYSELARSVAESGSLQIRDVGVDGFSFVYSILIAPAYALAPGLVAGYAAAKAVSAVLFSLTAVPAYLLARRLLSPGWSVVAAALAIAVPSATYAGGLMTENAFYPVFVTFALVLVSTLERPSVGRQLLLLGIVGVAFFTRAQAVALLPAIVTAVALVAVLDARAAASRRWSVALGAIARYWPTWISLAVGGLAVLLAQALRGQRLAAALGAYSEAAHSYSPTETARWVVYHVAELDLYLGVLPLAAFVVVASTAAALPQPRRVRIFAAATIALTGWMVLLAAATSAELPEGHTALPPRVHERYVFYVAPLFLTLLLLWTSGGMRRPRRAVWAAAVPAALLPAVVPYDELGHLTSESLAVLPWTAVAAPNVWVLVPSVLLAAVFVALPRRLAVVVPILIAANFLVIRSVAAANGDTVSRWVLGLSVTVERDWIDEAVGSEADVAVLWIGQPGDGSSDHVGRGRDAVFRRHRAVWVNEFFNRSVRSVYHVGTPMLYGLPSQQLTLDTTSGALRDASGGAVRTEYVLAPASAKVRGEERARDRGTGLVLYRVRGALSLGGARP